jgi:hypothetical protein
MVIGKNTLKNYEFKTLEEYFNYIVDSEINGQYKQMKELYNKFSRTQKIDFLKWLRHNEINNINCEDLL